MDQVRAIARVLWTQRFWVLSVICAIVGAVCWNMASTDISAQFTKRKGVIDGAFRDVSAIRSEAVHPNDDVNAGDLEQAKLQRNFVRAVWSELYQSQRSKVLYWPKSLGDDFVTKIEGKKFGDKISSGMRDRYLNYIETRFDALLEIVQAKKIAEGGARGGGGGYGGEFGGGGYGGGGTSGVDGEEEDDYLVQWLDQGKLQKKLYFKAKPSAMQVWVTQEDLWVYETLLDVIAKANKERGATRPDNTAVRVIVALEVGSAAAAKGKSAGRVYIPKSIDGAAGGEYGGEFGGGYGGEFGGGDDFGGGYGEEMGGGYGGGYGGEFGGGGGGASDTALLENRYLDAEGNPDPAASGTFGTTEFRQLPIRMTLMMDQRYIPQVLIECANAALPVEVKQLRVNPSKSSMGLKGSRSSSRSTSRNLQGVAPDVNLAEVEIRGAVYIYNEPDSEALNIPGAEEDAAEDSI